MTEYEALMMATARGYELLERAGAGALVAKLVQVQADDNSEAVAVLVKELEQFPEWHEATAMLDAARISEECWDTWRRYKGYIDLGDEETIEAKGVFLRLMRQSPRWLLDELTADIDLPISGYLEDGTPMCRAEDIAAQMGLTEEEAQQAIASFIAAGEAEGLPLDGIVTDGNLIHGVQ